MTTTPPFDSALVERLAKVLGETTFGFTGPQIADLLRSCRIPDPGETTKWKRIKAALIAEQASSRSGNCVIVFLKTAMTPVRWVAEQDRFEAMRSDLNAALAFAGLEIKKDGKVYRRSVAQTHDEAQVRARRLRDELIRRGGHADVFKYCTRELLLDDCYGAAFEATKGLGERVREMTGLDADGHQLVQMAFEGGAPFVAFNSLVTETDRNEQRGLANIMKGIFSAFRNPTAHNPRLIWHIREEDALDLLSTLSLLHRRLDTAVVIRRN